MTPKQQTLAFCELLNAGTPVREAAEQVDLDPDDLYGESFLDSSEAMDVEDETNNVIDVAWDGDLHYQLRRWWDADTDRHVWEAFERRTLTKGGKPLGVDA